MRRITALILSLLLLTLALPLAASAEAVTPVYAEGFQAVRIAAKALEASYGITPEMLVYFCRTVAPAENGAWRVTWTGDDVFITALGVYTATVSGGQAQVTWSHDGKPNDGTYGSSVWDSRQLTAMMEKVGTAHDYSDEWLRAREIMDAAGEKPLTVMGLPYEEEAPEGDDTETVSGADEAQALAKVSLEDAEATARAAIREVYGLNEDQMTLIEWQDDEVMNNGGYRMEDGVPKLGLHYWLWQGSDEYTPMDGGYHVLIRLDTGVVEDVHFESNLAGNG